MIRTARARSWSPRSVPDPTGGGPGRETVNFRDLLCEESTLVGENVPDLLRVDDIPEGGHDFSSATDDVDVKGLVSHLPGFGVGEIGGFFHEGRGGHAVSVSLDPMALDAESLIDLFASDGIPGRSRCDGNG